MTPYRKVNGRHRLLVNLTLDGKSQEKIVLPLIAETFLGPCPPGHYTYHKNGCQSDNYVNNIAYISQQELGRLTGAKSRRMPVVKINDTGEIVSVYTSARETARQNHMSYQTVIDRCNGKCKGAYAPNGYAYAWEDKERSMQQALRKIELDNGYMQKATDVVFDW